MRKYVLSEDGGIGDEILKEQYKARYGSELEQLKKEGSLTLEPGSYANNVCSAARRVFGEKNIQIEKNNGEVKITYRQKN